MCAKKVELKTRPTDQDVTTFLAGLEENRRAECETLITLMQQETGAPPTLWGSIVGFGEYHYRYASGREGDWFLTGFAVRKNALTLYIMAGFEQYDNLMQTLGRYTTGKSCLYLKRLSDVDLEVVRELVRQSVAHLRASNPM
ncbi:MAG: hypothetical protein OHK0052_27050 [Anaerolineales bacterium]